MKRLRYAILNFFSPLIKWTGRLHSPWSRKEVSAHDLDVILSRIKPADILLSYTKGEFTNMTIPSRWKHVAFVSTDKRYVIEANSDGVIKTDIRKFCLSKDNLCLVRSNLDDTCQYNAAKKAEDFLGYPYDYFFEIPNAKNESFYCSELPYWCFKKVCIDFQFRLKETMGVETIVPDDYFLARKHFSFIWQKRSLFK